MNDADIVNIGLDTKILVKFDRPSGDTLYFADDPNVTEVVAFGQRVQHTAVTEALNLHNWTFKRTTNKPFVGIEIVDPQGRATTVYTHDRNPENILYALADAMMKARGE